MGHKNMFQLLNHAFICECVNPNVSLFSLLLIVVFVGSLSLEFGDQFIVLINITFNL